MKDPVKFITRVMSKVSNDFWLDKDSFRRHKVLVAAIRYAIDEVVWPDYTLKEYVEERTEALYSLVAFCYFILKEIDGKEENVSPENIFKLITAYSLEEATYDHPLDTLLCGDGDCSAEAYKEQILNDNLVMNCLPDDAKDAFVDIMAEYYSSNISMIAYDDGTINDTSLDRDIPYYGR